MAKITHITAKETILSILQEKGVKYVNDNLVLVAKTANCTIKYIQYVIRIHERGGGYERESTPPHNTSRKNETKRYKDKLRGYEIEAISKNMAWMIYRNLYHSLGETPPRFDEIDLVEQ